MKILSWTWLFISLIIAFISCRESEQPVGKTETVSGEYRKGCFVVNEGNFGWGFGEISFIGEDGKTENNIFGANNQGKVLGNVAQSMTIFEEKAYIVVNNSQKIEVLAPKTMKSLGTISGFISPRYFCALNSEKAFVTDLYANGVWVVNPKKMLIEKKIPFDGWSEGILADGKNLLVCNMKNGSLVVFDAFSEEKLKEISLHKEAQSLVKVKSGDIWVLCAGGLSEQNAEIFVIDSKEFFVKKSFKIQKRASNLQTDASGENVYFLSQGLYKMNINAAAIPEKPVILQENALFYGFIVKKDGDILLSDARDYVQRGKVTLFDQKTFLPKNTYEAGIIPGFFCEIAQ